MVNQLVYRLTLMMFLLTVFAGIATHASAAETLIVETDSKRLYQGEVLALTVTGVAKIHFNQNNLHNFSNSSLPSPDIEKVEPDFEILRRNQTYSIRTLNSEMVSEITWNYQLVPRTTGRLTIPSLTFQGAVSEPITIEVVDDTPPDHEAGTRESFIELSADKDSVYVQEQLVLTVKLFFKGNLIRGELSEPVHPNAVIESLGQQTEYSRFRDGKRFRVVERRYAIFPQKPGELSLQPIRFEGQARDASGRLKFLRNSKQLFAIAVDDVPAEFSGDTWLPATEVTLSESGLPERSSIEAGENLSRSLSLMAQGLPAEALPPFTNEMPDGIRAYPEKPERDTASTKAGLVAQLTQTAALIPVRGGQVILPEVRIPWWDTTSDSEKMAVIPARTLNVQAGTVQGETQQPDLPKAGSPEPAQDQSSLTSNDASSGWAWKTIAAALFIGWLVTALMWWLSRRKKPESTTKQSGAGRSEKTLFSTLCDSARAGAPETPDYLIHWMNVYYLNQPITSLAEAFKRLRNPVLEQEIGRLQAMHYGNNKAGSTGTAESWQAETLLGELASTRAELAAKPEARSPLEPLYPEELNAR